MANNVAKTLFFTSVGILLMMFVCCGGCLLLSPSTSPDDPFAMTPERLAASKADDEKLAKREKEKADKQAENDRIKAEDDRIERDKKAAEEAAIIESENAAHLKEFKKLIADNKIAVVTKVLVNQYQAQVTVSNEWHLVPYQLRLQAAQNIQKLWAQTYTKDPKIAHIKFVDLNGNEVGGSGMLSASKVWVNE